MKKNLIDVEFDFTTDTPGFWDNFWEDEMGKSDVDPDIYSSTLKRYHKMLWSKKLPNGEVLNLRDDGYKDYLSWKNYRFGSDSITASFCYKNNRKFIKKVAESLPNYKIYMENYIRKSYTIGGAIIFPKTPKSINQMRGWNYYIKDRFDLTLECIRKFYKNEPSPLYEVLSRNKQFFGLFVDFKGYVNFFYLNDLVESDYSAVKFWLGNGKFDKSPMPQSVEDYLSYMDNQMAFVNKRNKRISLAINKNQK